MTDRTDIANLRLRANNLRTADQTDAFIDLLLDKLEAEHQRVDAIRATGEKWMRDCKHAEAELAKILGNQEPYAYALDTNGICSYLTKNKSEAELHKRTRVEGTQVVGLFTNPTICAVVLPEPYDDGHGVEWFSRSSVEAMLKDAGITIKQGK